MKIRTRAVWLPAVTLLATSCITGAVLSLDDSARANIQTARPGAWMASEQAGSVSHLGPDGVDATVELAHSAGDLHIVQVDGVAYVSDSDGRLSRIDPAQLEVAQEAMLPSSTAKLVAGGGKLYAVDGDTGIVRQLDPVQLTSIGQPVNVGTKLGAAVVDDNGVLWVSDLSTGKVVAIDGQTVGTAHQVAQPGVDVRLSVVGSDVVAVNPSTATATVVSGTTPSTPHPVPTDTGGVLDIPENVEQGSVLPIVTGPHTLTLLQVRSGEARKVELPVSGHTFGTPKVSGQRVYLADFTNGSLIVIDITNATVLNTVKITGKPGPFEVLVDGSTVYVNDPTSEHAWTIGASGEAVPADKYDPDSPRGGGAVQSVVPPAPSLPTSPPPPADDGNGDDAPTTTTTTAPAATTSTTVRSRDDHDQDHSSTTSVRHDGDHTQGTTPATPGRGHTTTTTTPNGTGTGTGPTVTTIVVGPGGGTGVTAPGTTTTTVPTGDGAVGAVTAIAGDGAATVSWTPPGGWHTITGYTIVVKPSGGGAPAPTTLQVDAAATGFTVRPLENGRAYSFDVTAQSAQGTGRTVSSNRVVPTKNAPKAPTNIGVTPGDAQVVVTWQAPTGPPVDGYVVDIVDGRGATVASLPAGASAATATLTRLPNGVELRAAVHATVDANGTTIAGAVATSSPFITKGKPLAPTSVIAAVTGPGRVRVTWMAAGDNGSPVTGYVVTAGGMQPPSGGLGADGASVPAGPGATQAEITGLQVAHSYAITVTATNDFGSTVSTEPVRVLVETTNGPAAPANVTATSGYHAVTIAWAPANGNGTGIANYYVRNLNDGTSRTVPAGSQSFVFDGLTPDVTYTFDVWAGGTNGVMGTPALSPPTVAAGTLPVGPVVASLATDTVVNLAVPPVAPPPPGFPAIASWEVTTVPDSGLRSFPTTTPLLVVDSLALGTSYTFNVVAVDAAGGRSAPSSATISTGSGAPPTPTGFLASVRVINNKIGTVRVTFTWNAVPGATSYTLDRGTGVPPVVVTATTYAYTTVGDDVDYTASLTATNGYGTSPAATRTYYVPYVAGTCPGCIPP